MDDSEFLSVGRITSAHGIKGWVKFDSYTSPVTNICSYKPLYWRPIGSKVAWQTVKLAECRQHGRSIVARVTGCNDRNAAELLRGNELAVKKTQLPPPEEGEYYWIDIIGLQVETVDAVELGTVDEIMETGSNEVLVVNGDRKRLIPFIEGEVVQRVSIAEGLMIVDWDPDF